MADHRIPRYADASCTLSLHVNCNECKMKMTEVIRSMNGVCDVNVEDEGGIVKISGEADTKAFCLAISRLGGIPTGGEHGVLVRCGADIKKNNKNLAYGKSNHINGGNALKGGGHGGGKTVAGRRQTVQEHPTKLPLYVSGRRQRAATFRFACFSCSC